MRTSSGAAAQSAEPGPDLNLPNLITIARILLVPVVVWAIASGEMQIAFLLFLAAGVSDAVDGFLAKRFGMATELGAYLDPLADKALIVSIYVALGITEAIPRWLVILVVSRDILIVGGVMLSWFLGKPIDACARCWCPSSTPWRRSCSPAWCSPRSASASMRSWPRSRLMVAGRRADPAVDRLLRARMGSPHERGASEHRRMSNRREGPRDPAAARPRASGTTRASPARIFSSARANAAALALVERWPDWPARIVVLVGPEGSGKSHLAAIWAERPAPASSAARALDQRPCRRRSRPVRW